MRMWREVSSGATEAQVRRVVASIVRVGAVKLTAEDVTWLHALLDYEPAPASAPRPANGAWLRDLLTRAR